MSIIKIRLNGDYELIATAQSAGATAFNESVQFLLKGPTGDVEIGSSEAAALIAMAAFARTTSPEPVF